MFHASTMRATGAPPAMTASCCSTSSPSSRPASALFRRERRAPLVVTRAGATEEKSKPSSASIQSTDDLDNIGDFCSLDKAVRSCGERAEKRRARAMKDDVLFASLTEARKPSFLRAVFVLLRASFCVVSFQRPRYDRASASREQKQRFLSSKWSR